MAPAPEESAPATPAAEPPSGAGQPLDAELPSGGWQAPGAGQASTDPRAEGALGSAAQAPAWLTVLYDAGCPLCRWVRGWLERQALLVPLVFVPLRSPQAWTAFPFLDHEQTAREVTVVSETGAVWTADAAWIMCLWATARFRGLAMRLAEPAWRPRARSVALSVAALTSRTPPPQQCPPDVACRVDHAPGGSSVGPGSAGRAEPPLVQPSPGGSRTGHGARP